MFKNIGATELIIIAIVLLVLFGSKKLNELARGLGESTKEVRKLKKEYKDTVEAEIKNVKESINSENTQDNKDLSQDSEKN